MTTIFVKKEILNWALDRSGLTVEDLQNKFSKIKQWFSGQNQPTLRQLESFAKATSTPLGYFFLETPPEEQLPIPYFRTIRGDKSCRPDADLLETLRTMQQRQSWMREYLVEQGIDKLPFIQSAKRDESPVSIAERIRLLLGFDEEWASVHSTWTEALKTMRETMEAVGILVVFNGIVGNNTHRKLDPDEFRGFVLVDEYAPLVFVNGADTKAAQMFTLAHEIAHIFLGSSAAFDLRQMIPANDQTEIACNRIAAEFLVPQKILLGIWPSAAQTTEPFQTIARRFKVSSLVAARRALDLQLITQSAFFKFYHDYLRDEKRTAPKHSEGGNFYAVQNLRVGQKFAKTVARAVKEGKLLYTEAYKLTGLHGRSFERYVSHIGMQGA
ncbi:MAG TPA: ImmA/IrrE family metallo-endopeptidase [Phycisphaerales bacterium]|nr:ImmA/IrrE family metallo-endopeptidase [Phycisphaerales bacterium]